MCSLSWFLTSLVFTIASSNIEHRIFVSPVVEANVLESGEIILNISGLEPWTIDFTLASFDTIYIKCASRYPNKWTFASNPLNTSDLTFYIEKKRDAKNIIDNTTFTYESELVFRVRSSIIAQAIACEHYEGYKAKDSNLTTYVTIKKESKTEALRILISKDKIDFSDLLDSLPSDYIPIYKGFPAWPRTVSPRLGSNENCTMALYIDRKSRKFSCGYKRNIVYLPGYEDTFKFLPCNDNDECSAMITEDQCPNSEVESCEALDCKTFPANTPGIIVCEAGPDAGRKTSIARAIFPSVGNPPIYYMKNDEVNTSQVLKVQVSSSGSIIFERDLVHAICTGASFFFTRGFRWGFQRNDDTIEYVPKERASETFFGAYYIAQLDVRLNDTGVKLIICYAPKWNSYNYETASLPIKIREIPPPDLQHGKILEIKEVGEGESVTLECILEQTDVPPVSFEWLKNGSSDQPKRLICQSENDLNKNAPLLSHVTKKSCHIQVNAEGTSTTLSIFDSLEANKYTCIATNKKGVKRSRHIQVRVTQPSISTGDPSRNYAQIVIPVVSIIILLIGAVGLIYYSQKNKKIHRDLCDDEIAEFDNGSEEPHDSIPYRNPYSLAYNRNYEIPRAGFTIEEGKFGLLGRGAYGLVQKGKCVQGNRVVDVAVKTVMPSIDVVYFKALLSELKLIVHIGSHPNIVQLIGACTQQIRFRNLFVLLEFCPNGNLLDFLKKKKDGFQNLVVEDIIHYENIPGTNNSLTMSICSTIELVRFCLDIIHALEFLKQKQVIHGDIAARNILLDHNLKAKLADFGLSRILLKCENYVKTTREPLPWRYMAIESLESNTFSFQSDIWAFGVTMWEIFTLGLIPHSSLNYSPEFVSFIANGLRLPKPEFATTAIHEQILLECWKKKPEERISLDKMKTYFYNLSSALQPELEQHYIPL